MNRTVTFYGNGQDQFGMPTPYHRYFIVEGPAPWLSQNATASSIMPIVQGCPMPPQTIYTVANPNASGEAIDAAIAALQALAQNQGLNMI